MALDKSFLVSTAIYFFSSLNNIQVKPFSIKSYNLSKVSSSFILLPGIKLLK